VYLQNIRARAYAVTAAVLAVALASCAKPPPPVVVAPPAPATPMRPYPPLGASPNYVLPPLAPDGKRVTVNTGISAKQQTWNMRAAFNVAALNCLRPQHAQILDGYKAFLNNHKRELLSTYKAVEGEFKAKHKSKGLFERDLYMTQVYNHYAFPPTLMEFCDGILAMSLESAAVKSSDLDAFAATRMPILENIFQNFYAQYDRYKIDLAQWDAQYGAMYGPQALAAKPAQPGVLTPPGLTIPPATAPATGTNAGPAKP